MITNAVRLFLLGALATIGGWLDVPAGHGEFARLTAVGMLSGSLFLMASYVGKRWIPIRVKRFTLPPTTARYLSVGR